MNGIILGIFTNYVVPLLGSAILAIGGYGLSLLNKKLKNEQIKQALDQLSKITKSVVQNLNQTIVADLKEKSADGKLTSQEMTDIKNKAITLIKAQMQDELLNLLAKNTDIDSLISTEIESNIFQLK